MTFDQFIYLLIAFIFSFYMSHYIKKIITNKKLVSLFFHAEAFDEHSAKGITELVDKDRNQNIKLAKYFTLFKNEIISTTKDKRLFINRDKYKQLIIKDIIKTIIIMAVLLIPLVITLLL